MWTIKNGHGEELAIWADRDGLHLQVENESDRDYQNAYFTLTQETIAELIAELERHRNVDA